VHPHSQVYKLVHFSVKILKNTPAYNQDWYC
jgi:hypothetical protein